MPKSETGIVTNSNISFEGKEKLKFIYNKMEGVNNKMHIVKFKVIFHRMK